MTDQEFVKLHYPDARVAISNHHRHIVAGDVWLGSERCARCDFREQRAWADARANINSSPTTQEEGQSPTIKLTYYVGDEDRPIEMRSATNNRMAICTGDGTIFITREQAKAFFGFKD